MTQLAIELDGVGKTYPYFALNDIRIELPQGCVMEFIGPNGAGKSTTMRIMVGLIHQDCGSVRVLGQSVPSNQTAVKRDVGFVSEDMRLYAQATHAWHMNFVRSTLPGIRSMRTNSFIDSA